MELRRVGLLSYYILLYLTIAYYIYYTIPVPASGVTWGWITILLDLTRSYYLTILYYTILAPERGVA